MGDQAERDFYKKARNIVCGLTGGFIAGAFLLYRFDSGFAEQSTVLLSFGIAFLGFALALNSMSRERG